MIPDSDRGAGKAQIIYPDLSCFPQIGGKYESQLIDLDFPGLEEDFHICTTKYKKNFVCWFLSAFLSSDAREKKMWIENEKKTF